MYSLNRICRCVLSFVALLSLAVRLNLHAAEPAIHPTAFEIDAGSGSMTAMKAMRSRPVVLAGFSDGRVCYIDLERREVTSALPLPLPGTIHHLELNHDESQWAAVSSSGEIAELVIGNFQSNGALEISKTLQVRRRTEHLSPPYKDDLFQGFLCFSPDDRHIGLVLRNNLLEFRILVFNPVAQDSPIIDQTISVGRLSGNLPRFSCRQLVFFGDEQVAWIDSSNQRSFIIKVADLNVSDEPKVLRVNGAASWLVPRYDQKSFGGIACFGPTGRAFLTSKVRPSFNLFEYNQSTAKIVEHVFEFGEIPHNPIDEVNASGDFLVEHWFQTGGYKSAFELFVVSRSVPRLVFRDDATGFGFGDELAIVSDSRRHGYLIAPRKGGIAKVDLRGVNPPVVRNLTALTISSVDHDFQLAGRFPVYAVTAGCQVHGMAADRILKANVIRGMPLTDEMSDE